MFTEMLTLQERRDFLEIRMLISHVRQLLQADLGRRIDSLAPLPLPQIIAAADGGRVRYRSASVWGLFARFRLEASSQQSVFRKTWDTRIGLQWLSY